VNTLFMLMAQFDGAPTLELEKVAHLLGLSAKEANHRAVSNGLPIPVFRLRDSQKCPFMVHTSDLAQHIDRCRESANHEWERRHSL